MSIRLKTKLPQFTTVLALALILSACGGSTQNEPAKSAQSAGETIVQDTTGASGRFPNDSGVALTFSTAGFIDTANPFFKSFGNGRNCASCHQQAEGWTVTPSGLQKRFDQSAGTDPIFRLVDGANSPHAADATLDQKRAAYSMLLNKGVIRIGMPVPATAEFELVNTDDPYGYASATELSLFRRPLPSANLSSLSAVMWDGRETAKDATSTNCIRGTTTCFASIDFDLLHQANSATRGHAEAAQDLTVAEQRAIVDFEKALFSTQIFDSAAKELTAVGAKGGPNALAAMEFYFGMNDLQTGDYRTNTPFDPNVMKLYGAWLDKTRNVANENSTVSAREAVARGEVLFNTKPINIVGTKGINDALKQPIFAGTCTSCHNVPNSGNRSVPLPIDIGTSDASRRTPDMPLYSLRNKLTGEIVETTDPGRALVTGKWADIGKFKISGLRGLAARAPYFHDGSAKTLADTVTFYNTRFAIGLTQGEISDMVAFLKAL